jgi:prephenate dehydrogenase
VTTNVLVVGTGLIGGSVGLALRAAGYRVTGYDSSSSVASQALDEGAIDEAAGSLDEGVAANEIVLIATPVGEVLPTLERVADRAADGTIVTDVGSTKARIVEEAERLLGPSRPFVGGHPMAGTEGEGIMSARADLFSNALWILTPTSRTDSDAYRRVNSLVGAVGARTLALDPEEHDRLVALVSHLPYAIATVLMAIAGDEGDPRVFRTAAGSFRDVTRTAGSNPRIWRDIFATNRDAVLREIDQFSLGLTRLRTAIEGGVWDEFEAIVHSAREARKRFPAKGERAPVDPVTVEVAIPDRAGVLAEITTALGGGGINIEDIFVDHTPSGGVLRLLIDGHDVAAEAAHLLARHGFRTTIVEER